MAWLGLAYRNRPVSLAWVSGMARIVISGQWWLGGLTESARIAIVSFKTAVGSLCRAYKDCKADISSRLGLPRSQGVTVGMAFEVAVGFLAGRTKIARLVTSHGWAYRK